MGTYGTTADLMETFRSEFAYEEMWREYLETPLDDSGWTQADYDYADSMEAALV